MLKGASEGAGCTGVLDPLYLRPPAWDFSPVGPVGRCWIASGRTSGLCLSSWSCHSPWGPPSAAVPAQLAPGPGLQAPVSASPPGRASGPCDKTEQGRCCQHNRAQERGWPRPCWASPGRRRRRPSCARGSGQSRGVGGQGGRSGADGDGRWPLPASVLPRLVSVAPPPCQDEALSTTLGRHPPDLRLAWPLAGTLSTGSPPTRPRWGQASIVSAVWLFECPCSWQTVRPQPPPRPGPCHAPSWSSCPPAWRPHMDNQWPPKRTVRPAAPGVCGE